MPPSSPLSFNPVAWGYLPQNPGGGFTATDTLVGCTATKGGAGIWNINLPAAFALGTVGIIVTPGSAPGGVSINVSGLGTSSLVIHTLQSDTPANGLDLELSFVVYRIPSLH